MGDEAAVARDSGPLGIFRPRRAYVLPYWFLLAPCLAFIALFAGSECPRIGSQTTCFELDPLTYLGYALVCVAVCYPIAIALYAILPVEEWTAQSEFARALFLPSWRTMALLGVIIVCLLASLIISAVPNSSPEWLSSVAREVEWVLVYPAGVPVLLVNALFEAHAFLPTTIAIFSVLVSGAWHMLLAVGIDRLVGVVERWG